MRVLIAHNRYRLRGGEDRVVENEVALLRGAGHEVALFEADNDTIEGIADKVRTFLQIAGNAGMGRELGAAIDRFRPDVVHVHNFFPKLTPAVHVAAAGAGVAVVQTLHNYRLLCANAMFLRGGKVCEDCLTLSRISAIRHRCYRDSAIGSAAVVRLQVEIERKRLLADHVDRFICLSQFALDKFVEGGLERGKLCIKPNFCEGTDAPAPGAARDGALFVGRLSDEKGVDHLIAAWRSLPEIALRIAGSGPLEDTLKAMAPANVTFLGQVDAATVANEMRGAALMVLPSLTYEGFPMTIVEAFACGLPVAASNLGSMAEIVDPGVTGALFAPGDAAALAGEIRRVFDDTGRLGAMGVNARRAFDERYTAARNLARLEEIYAHAIDEAARRRDENSQTMRSPIHAD